MIPRRLVCAGAVVLAVGIVACGERIEAGLANAPSLQRKSEPVNQYDVLATGDEGCTNRDGGASIASAAGGCPKGGALVVPDAGPAATPR